MREADLRDAYHLAPVGEARGPDGDLLAFWREAARLRLAGKDWSTNLADVVGPTFELDVAGWMVSATARAKTHGPLAGSVSVMRAVLEVDDRAERTACLLSDLVLIRTLDWPSLLPVTALHLTKTILRDLVAEGQGGDLSVQRKILESIEDTIRISRDLSSKAAALRAVAPKLRANGSVAAVDLFLADDPGHDNSHD